jgi:hypothetical protein
MIFNRSPSPYRVYLRIRLYIRSLENAVFTKYEYGSLWKCASPYPFTLGKINIEYLQIMSLDEGIDTFSRVSAI